MKSFYKFISYLLLPPALIYSMKVLVLIAAALANPAMLVFILLVVSVAVYTFISFYFLIKGIFGNNKLTPSTLKWIKVTAVVTAAFSLLILAQFFFYFFHPEMKKEVMDQFMKQQQGGMTFTRADLEKYTNLILDFFLIHCILLLVHIFLTFKFIKANADLFEESKT